MPTVLVTGATGTVGSAVVDELRGRDATVRAAVRDPEGVREESDDEAGVEAVAFDFERPETWGAALAGVDALFLVRPPAVGVGALKRFADAAARVGVDRVAYLSVLGAERNPLLPHRRIERHLSGLDVDHCFLRASFFAQNLLEVHREDVVRRGQVFVPAGDGRTSFVDARDVGAVAATVLVEPGHGTRAYDLTGPEALDYGEVAAILTDVLDRPVSYADPSMVGFVRRMLGRDHPVGFVLVMVGIYATVRLGFAGRVTDDVERVLGREPRDLRTFVADHREALTPDPEAADVRVAVADRPPELATDVANPVLTRLLRSRFHGLVSDSLLLLTVTGRRTGAEYTFPVGYEQRGGRLLVTTHHSTWWRNLRGGAPVTVVLRGERRAGHAEAVTDPEAVAEYLESHLVRNGPGAGRRVGVSIEGDGVPTSEQLRDVVDGNVILVEIALEEG